MLLLQYAGLVSGWGFCTQDKCTKQPVALARALARRCMCLLLLSVLQQAATSFHATARDATRHAILHHANEQTNQGAWHFESWWISGPCRRGTGSALTRCWSPGSSHCGHLCESGCKAVIRFTNWHAAADETSAFSTRLGWYSKRPSICKPSRQLVHDQTPQQLSNAEQE